MIDNRPGAGSTIGHALGAKATPDGYTLLLGTSAGLAVSPAFGIKLPYDPVKDLTPMGLAVYVPFLLVVHPSVPAKNEGADRSCESATRQSQFRLTRHRHAEPSRDGAPESDDRRGLHPRALQGRRPATADLVAGRIQAIFGSFPQWQPHLASAMCARSPSVTRSARNGCRRAGRRGDAARFNNTSWYGFFAPIGIPPAIVSRINAEMKLAVANPEFVKQLEPSASSRRAARRTSWGTW